MLAEKIKKRIYGGYSMIYAEKGKEQDSFIDFVEKALGKLSEEKYSDFLAMFDSSRLTEQDLIFALRD